MAAINGEELDSLLLAANTEVVEEHLILGSHDCITNTVTLVNMFDNNLEVIFQVFFSLKEFGWIFV
jgi:hypothetical protein